MAAGPNELTTLLMLFFSSGFGSPFGLPPEPVDPILARVAPDECVFYTAWAARAEPDANSPNQTEQLLAEPEVQQLIDTLTRRLDETIQQAAASRGNPQSRVVAEVGPKLLKLLVTHSAALFVSKADIGPGGPDIEAGMLINAGDDVQQFSDLLKRLQTEAMGVPLDETEIAGIPFYRLRLAPQLPPALWGVRGKYVILGVGEQSVESMFQRVAGEPPEWLVQLHERMRVDRISSISYVNIGKLVDTFLPLIPEPRVGQAIELLGLSEITEFASVAGLDGSGFVSRSWVGLDGPPRGLLAPLGAEPLNAEDLAEIPHDATVVSAFKLDLGSIFDTWLDVAKQVEPGAADEIQRELGQLEEELDIKVRDGLLRSLGDVWTVSTAPSDGGLLTGWTASVQVRDRQQLAEIHDQLVEKLNAEFAGQRRALQIRQLEFAGQDIYYLSVADDFPLSPAWCLTEDRLVVCLFSQTLKSYLSRDDSFQSIADQAGVEKLFQGDTKPLAVTYVDSKSVFRTTYPLLQILAHVGLAQARKQGIDLDAVILPSGRIVERHLLPYVSILRRTDTGGEMITHQTLPGANIGTTAPIAVGLLLPAVQAAREAARRAQSMNNMKQIGLAMHNFHDVYRQFPAAYNVDKDGKPLLSWRVHILPFVEQQSLYEQFHLDEPWDSEHNRQFIQLLPPAYRSPSSRVGGGRTVYLGIRGEDKVFVAPKQEAEPRYSRLGTGIRDITDGTSNTAMVVEASDQQAVIWTKPDDFEPDEQDPMKGLTGMRPNGFLALFCDGSVRFIAQTIDRGTLKALFTKGGGEAVQIP